MRDGATYLRKDHEKIQSMTASERATIHKIIQYTLLTRQIHRATICFPICVVYLKSQHKRNLFTSLFFPPTLHLTSLLVQKTHVHIHVALCVVFQFIDLFHIIIAQFNLIHIKVFYHVLPVTRAWNHSTSTLDSPTQHDL